MMGEPADVLVVGAGPSGLALALQAHDHGASVRVLERRLRASRPSRAMMLHPRTLEVLRPLGVCDELLAAAGVSPAMRLHLGRREISVKLDDFPLTGTSFPHLVFIRQAAVEAVLAAALAARGIAVEYGAELSAVRAQSGMTVARVRRGTTAGELACRYVAGCDGAHSSIRRQAGIAWDGAAYRHEVLLADVELDGALAPGVSHAVAGRAGVIFLFALGEGATWRMLATRPARPAEWAAPGSGTVLRSQLQQLLDAAGVGTRITRVARSGSIGLQHRVAARYRVGPLFVVGDAAHVNSPAGGQGMNLGIQDATNLGWKLAFASRACGVSDGQSEVLLESYGRERRAVALRTVALTHAIFWAEAHTDPLAAFVRGSAVPFAAPVLPFILRRRRLVAAGVRLLSQLDTRYPRRALSFDSGPRVSGGPRVGERVPDAVVQVDDELRRLHEVLAQPGVHVLLEAQAAALDPTPADRRIHVRRVQSWLGRGVVVVRPDGYVGYRSTTLDVEALGRWFALVGLRAEHAPGPFA